MMWSELETCRHHIKISRHQKLFLLLFNSSFILKKEKNCDTPVHSIYIHILNWLKIDICLLMKGEIQLTSSGPGPRSGPGQVPGQVQKV